jgi:hypothetical protein
MVDCFVVHSATPTRVASEVKAPLNALKTYEKTKINKYAATCEEQGLTFVPFGSTTHGVLTPKAIGFLRLLASHSDDPRCDLNYMLLQHSIATQRAVARTLISRLSRDRASAFRSVFP